MLHNYPTQHLLFWLRCQESAIRRGHLSKDDLRKCEAFAIDLRNELLSRGLSEEEVYPDWVYS